MDARDSYSDSYMYYSQDVDGGTNYPSNNGSGIKEDVARLSESASEDEHYYPHTTAKVECNQSPSPRASNDEFVTKRPQDSTPTYDGVPPVKKGRGRPKKIYDGIEIKEWSDEEIYKLIEIWGKHDVLYNCKHPLYHNKTEKSNAIETIRENLEEAGITANTRQICDKLTTLRNYYGAVKRKTDSLKRQGFEGEDAYFCRWQFYQPLSFLEGTFSPRQSEYHTKKMPYVMETISLMTPERSLSSLHTITTQQGRPLSRETFDCPKEPIQQNSNQMTHLSSHSHSNQTCRSYLDHHPNQSNHATKLTRTNQSDQHNQQQNNVTLTTQTNHTIHGRLSNQPNHSIQPMHRTLPSPIQSNNTAFLDQSCQTPHHAYNTGSDNKSEDQLFGEMVAKMISGIADLEAKALLLIRIQQDIVQTKFRTKTTFQKPRTNSTSWNNNYTQTKESNTSHGYDAEQKVYRSIEHSPISSRSDSPLSSPACTPKLDNITSVNPEVIT